MDEFVKKYNSLIVRIGRGDVNALDELYADYGGLLYNMAKKYLADKSYAEDVVSEVLCKVVKYSNTFNPRLNGLNWTFKIVKNTCIDWNKKWDRDLPEPEYEELSSVLPLQDDVAAQSDLKEALSLLTVEENSILYFKFWEGFTVREIAQKLHKPKSSIQYVYKQAIKKIMAYLDEKD